MAFGKRLSDCFQAYSLASANNEEVRHARLDG